MEIIINQDIRKFKTKDIGNFSFKEAGFIVLAAVVGYGTYALEKIQFEEAQMESCVLVAAIPLVIGFLKPFGMTFIQFIKTYVSEKFITPSVYKWRSDFVYQMDEFGEIYGEEYAISDERAAMINYVSHLDMPEAGNHSGEMTKEERAARKAAQKLGIK